MSKQKLVTRGRYQPFGHHHFAVIDYFAGKHDADVVYIVVEGLSSGRTFENPFTGEEVKSMIEEAFESDYDVGYKVEVVNQRSIFQRDVIELLSEDLLYFTREISHKRFLSFLRPFIMFFCGGDFHIDYEPRSNMAPFEMLELPYELSSTRIRYLIRDGGDWERYVADSVVDIVDSSEGIEAIREGESGGKYRNIVLDFLR